MFNAAFNGRKSKPDPAQEASTLLAPGTRFRGEVHSGPSTLKVEGQFDGSIFSEGRVVVLAPGVVTGIIHAKELIVSGRVEGVFKIEGCLEIRNAGQVEGDVEAGSLVVDEGASFQGNCSRHKEKEKGAAAPASGKAFKKLDAMATVPAGMLDLTEGRDADPRKG